MVLQQRKVGRRAGDGTENGERRDANDERRTTNDEHERKATTCKLRAPAKR